MSEGDFERDMLIKEAEWSWNEMQDFNRLVQRYRYTYVAALFASVGWALGQSLGEKGPPVFNSVGSRQDVAAILCVVPMITGVFALLTMEASIKVQRLARYRFLLGVRLGRNEPVWRWDLFRRDGEEGSIRMWENPTNVFLGLMTLIVNSLCLGLAHAAYSSGLPIKLLWWSTLVFVVMVVAVILFVAWKSRRENQVADPITTSYDDLRIVKPTMS